MRILLVARVFKASCLSLALLCIACGERVAPPLATEDPLVRPVIRQLVTDAEEGHTLQQSRFFPHYKMTQDELVAAESYLRDRPKASGFHMLMLLREQHHQRYQKLDAQVKQQVIIHYLCQSVFMNDWSTLAPGVDADGPAGEALIELGPSIIPALRPLLDDRTEVRCYGSQSARASRVYNYRRADFAYRYILLLLHRKPVFEKSPDTRDALIATLKTELALAK